jgi:hypothetical protein
MYSTPQLCLKTVFIMLTFIYSIICYICDEKKYFFGLAEVLSPQITKRWGPSGAIRQSVTIAEGLQTFLIINMYNNTNSPQMITSRGILVHYE